MKAFQKLAVAVAAAVIAFVSPARAGSVSDLWWNPAESGWGVNVVRQGDTMFLTFFVYAQDGQPLWLVAPSTSFVSDSSAGTVYSGPLYKTSGPWLGGSFNPAAVNVTQVGTATISWQSVTAATLTYSYSGTSVTKSLVRQTWTANYFLPGKYLGGIVLDRTGCSSPSRYESLAQFTVTMSGATMQVAMQPSGGGSWSGSGPVVQTGSIAGFSGTATSCASGASGTASFSAIEANSEGITGRIDATYPGGCRETGEFAGVFRAD